MPKKKVKAQTPDVPDAFDTPAVAGIAITSSLPDHATYVVDAERFANILVRRVASQPNGSIRQQLEAFLTLYPEAITNEELISAMDTFLGIPDVSNVKPE